MIRFASLSDVPDMVELSEQKRVQYQQYQPTFWRKAATSREVQTLFFERIVQDTTITTLVHVHDGNINGFVIARVVPVPPVYDPGGLCGNIDDFCVASGEDWQTVGKKLLDAAVLELKQKGAVFVVVVCGHADEQKRAMLFHEGLTIASEWYVKDI